MGLTVSLTKNLFPKIAADLPGAASTIVRKTSFDIEAHAKAVVPVDSGNLKNSITTEIESDGLSATIYTNVVYAARIEFGFVGADRLGRVYNQAPQPYMLPAAEAARPEFEAAFVQLEKLL